MAEITLFPVICLSGPDPLETHEFLASVAYEYVSTKYTYISNLEDTGILEDIRRSERSFNIAPHSAIEVQIYEVRLRATLNVTILYAHLLWLEADIRPAKQTTRAFIDAFRSPIEQADRCFRCVPEPIPPHISFIDSS